MTILTTFGRWFNHSCSVSTYQSLSDYKLSSPMVKEDGKYFVRRIQLPPDLPATVLGDLVKKCCSVIWFVLFIPFLHIFYSNGCLQKKSQRPSFQEIRNEFFADGFENPFNLSEKGEFFECGFLKDTQIFVADSVVKDSEVRKGWISVLREYFIRSVWRLFCNTLVVTHEWPTRSNISFCLVWYLAGRRISTFWKASRL